MGTRGMESARKTPTGDRPVSSPTPPPRMILRQKNEGNESKLPTQETGCALPRETVEEGQNPTCDLIFTPTGSEETKLKQKIAQRVLSHVRMQDCHERSASMTGSLHLCTADWATGTTTPRGRRPLLVELVESMDLMPDRVRLEP